MGRIQFKMKNTYKSTYTKKLFCMIAAAGVMAAAGCGTTETLTSRTFGVGSDIGLENGVTSKCSYEENAQSAWELG